MINTISNIIWLFTSFIILISGLYLSIKLGFPQFRIKTILKEVKSSSLSTLFLSLAGTIGVGSIAGIALSIYIGGVGSIFWIYVISLSSGVITYSETYLGVKYKVTSKKNYTGGPFYYIKNGLKNNKLSVIYAITLLITCIIGYISIQANTITKSIVELVNINPIYIATLLSILTFIVIIKGISSITKVTNKLVPIMTIVYISLSIVIIIFNLDMIPSIIKSIIVNAFKLKSFIPVLIIGIQRGIFSNESGLGTGSIAASSGINNNPIKEAYLQTLGIYITTFIICTSSAIIILTSNYQSINIEVINGIELSFYAFNYHFNILGQIILVISIFLFAFSSIITSFYYGETSLRFINNRKIYNYILKFITILIIFISSLIKSNILWKITDILIAILSLINIYSIIKLRNEIKR